MTAATIKTEDLSGKVVRLYINKPAFSAGILFVGSREVKFSVKGFVKLMEPVTLRGKWTTHVKYGRQFEASEVVYEMPTNPAGLSAWLRWAVPDVGPVKAQKMVDEFGADLPRLACEDPGQVAAVCGVPLPSVLMVAETWTRNASEIGAKSELASYGFGSSQVQALWDKYKGSAPKIIKEDPYLLLRDLPGFGWKKVDELARKSGIDRLHRGRVRAAVTQAVAEVIGNGSTCVDEGDAHSAAVGLLEVAVSEAMAVLDPAVQDAIEIGHLVSVKTGAGAFLSTPGPFGDESAIWKFLAAGRERNPFVNADPAAFAGAFKTLPMGETLKVLDDDQRAALETVASSRVAFVTGGAGSGKTLIATAIHRMFSPLTDVFLCAPTGKAARRLEDVVGRGASTIHRLLGYNPDGGWFYHAGNKLPKGVVLVDECFVRGTLIDTPGGGKRIETLKRGDTVYSAIGVDVVTNTKRREANHVIRVKAGSQTFICSENHPFFTTRGWVVAGELESGDCLVSTTEAMRLLRNGFIPNPNVTTTETVLSNLLLNEMVDAIPKSQGQSIHARTCKKFRHGSFQVSSLRNARSECTNRTHSAVESYRQSRNTREAIATSQGNRLETASEGREWKGNDRAAAVIIGNSRVMVEARICNRSWEEAGWIPDQLQTRFGRPDHENWYRSRWAVAPREETFTGCKEGRETSYTRVDSVEVLEQGNPELDQFRNADGKLYLYDIEVAQHPTFSVNGCLVHNCSMIDSSLAASLFAALTPEHAIVLIGDPNQLQPVGAGAMLRDAIAENLAPVARLGRCHRQAGPLKMNCAGILEGQMNYAPAPGEGDTPAWLVHRNLDGPERVTAAVERLFTEHLPKWGYDSVKDVQFLTARHAGPFGTQRLNRVVQRLRQRQLGIEIELPAVDEEEGPPVLRAGDRVIHTRNNYQLEVMNGAQGIVVQPGNGPVVDYDGRMVIYPKEFASEVQLGYVLTPHKAQGSEWPCAVVICPKSHSFMQTRSWIYTAATRAKKTCVVIGDVDGIGRAVSRIETDRRRTLLQVFAAYPEARP